MKRLYTLLFTFLIFTSVNDLTAQKRYLEASFDNVDVSATMVYGQNFTMLPLISGQNTLRQPLIMNVYSPAGDTETERPLIIYLHTGNFFPYPLNGSCGGRLDDPSNVEMATRLAKMGYVVAVIDYRLGWFPTHPDELVRRFSLINAAYRGVQDTRTCIRYFKRSVAESANPFGIDPDKIVMWGQGTGGYISTATAYISSYQEIFQTADAGKFFLNGVPMVIEAYNGNIDGTPDAPTIVDAVYNAATGFPIGDTLCVSNHPGFSSDFQLAVNLGGALGDSSWMKEGEIPLISFHNPTDPFAPCETDVLNVPTAQGPQPVVEVSGSCQLSRQGDRLGLNTIFNTIPPGNDPYGDIAKIKNGGLNNFFPFTNTPNNDTSSPWEWMYEDDMPNPDAGCNFDAAYPQLYIDTIIGFFAPRACVTLGLNCDFTTSTKDEVLASDIISLTPNPASTSVKVTAKGENIESIAIFAMDGKLMMKESNVNSESITIQRNNLPTGIYFVKAFFEKGVATQKVVFE